MSEPPVLTCAHGPMLIATAGDTRRAIAALSRMPSGTSRLFVAMGLSTPKANTLLCYVNRGVKRHIAKLTGVEHHQHDDDAEVFHFPAERLDDVAAILKPKRLKGSAKLTSAQLANLQEGIRRLEKQRQESPETRLVADEGLGLGEGFTVEAQRTTP